MWIQALVPAMTVAFVVTVAFMLTLHPLAVKIGLVDRPGGRKLHNGNIPIIGGIAMFAGMATGALLLGLPTAGFLSALVAGLLLVLVGAIDDGITLPPSARVIAQIAVVLIMIYGGTLQLADIGDPFGTGVISMGRFSVIFTLVVSLTMINAYNLVDGIDGLAGSLAIVALVAVSVVAGLDSVFGIAALTVVASIVGFLLFNFPVKWNRSQRSFMGDAGSTLLGLAIVWLTIGISQGAERVISPVHCLWFAALPIFDCLTCFVRRSLKGKSPFTPGRDHFHHTLRRGGFKVRQRLGIIVGLQMLYAAVGISGHFAGVPDHIMFAAWSVLGLSQRRIIRMIAKSHRLHRLKLIRAHELLVKRNETAHT